MVSDPTFLAPLMLTIEISKIQHISVNMNFLITKWLPIFKVLKKNYKARRRSDILHIYS